MISLCIPHRGSPDSLWFTTTAMTTQLENTGIEYEFRIVANGDCPRLEPIIDSLRNSGHLGHYEHVDDALSPPAARQRAANGAAGTVLWFGDNHILFGKDYFLRSLSLFAANPKLSMLHTPYKFYVHESQFYHYELDLEYAFWGNCCLAAPSYTKPYRIAFANHASFFVRRSDFEEVAGYGPADLFVGWGGEEAYLDLKFALLDKSNWLDPTLLYYHLPSVRGYPRYNSDAYFVNMMVCALVIGGEHWIDRVYCSFRKQERIESPLSMFDLYEQAYKRGHAHAMHLASIRHRTLDEQLIKFKNEGVAH